jgi:hypothetical protein
VPLTPLCVARDAPQPWHGRLPRLQRGSLVDGCSDDVDEKGVVAEHPGVLGVGGRVQVLRGGRREAVGRAGIGEGMRGRAGGMAEKKDRDGKREEGSWTVIPLHPPTHTHTHTHIHTHTLKLYG